MSITSTITCRLPKVWEQKPLSRHQLLSIACRYADFPGTCLLYSGGSYDSAIKSYLCLYPDQTFVLNEPSWEKVHKTLRDAFWVGYLAYEMGATSDNDVHFNFPKPEVPYAYFTRPTVILEVDHSTNLATLYSSSIHDLEISHLNTAQQISQIVHCSDTYETYQEKIHTIMNLINIGEVYQINLSQQFTLLPVKDPFALFYQLTQSNPSPFSAFIRMPSHAIISSSPERFLRKGGSRLETRPIKGTMSRGNNPQQDIENKRKLLNSLKERAELLMITDLMRNDLSKVSIPGTVVVDRLCHCEAYSNVFHLLSVIHSQCEIDHPIEILRACFPAGSISGCPKLRAMEAIRDCEQRPRGVYTGSIGYINEVGDFDFNVAIRTFVQSEQTLDVQLGGAIVADSNPEAEYQETLAKGATLFDILSA